MRAARPLSLLVAPVSFLLAASFLSATPQGANAGVVAPMPVVADSLDHPDHPEADARGRSGALRVAILRVAEKIGYPIGRVGESGHREYRWQPLFGGARPGLLGTVSAYSGADAPPIPGVWRLLLQEPQEAEAIPGLSLITQMPFTEKRGGQLNGYRIGTYPAEGASVSQRYAPPEGFIEVTPENQDLQISEHFRLRQFLTKDQFAVWPKYVAIDLRLIDKLELVIQELNAMGIPAKHVHVMSGFRTPQYNGPGGDGRAKLSRHTYGDAADIWVDEDGDGYMDDLNGDGRRDVMDAEVILYAVDRVEKRFPELVGGAGVYGANGSRGPFIHIDTRGVRARW